MEHPANVATPLTTVTGLDVQESVPPPGFVEIASDTVEELSVVTTFPYWSSSVNCGWMPRQCRQCRPLSSLSTRAAQMRLQTQ